MERLTVTHQVSAVLEEFIARPAKEEGMSVTEALLLSQIARHPGATCTELAWQVVRDRGNTQRTLVALEKRQLVAADRIPGDTRDVSWGLTERGAAIWRIVENRIVLQELELERSIPDLRECFDRLRRIAQRLSELSGARRSSWGDYSRPAPAKERDAAPH
jgi:DNA-binding MarR family transcriptional regulator